MPGKTSLERNWVKTFFILIDSPTMIASYKNNCYNSMRGSEEEKKRYRELNLKMSELHLQQKNSFRKLFDSGIKINWRDPKIFRLICQGVPSAYRSRVWPHLLDNSHGINTKYYETLLRKAENMLSAEESHVIAERARTIKGLQKI